jgi:hypothetical protein
MSLHTLTASDVTLQLSDADPSPAPNGGATARFGSTRIQHTLPQMSDYLLDWLQRENSQNCSNEHSTKQRAGVPLRPFANQGFQGESKLYMY